MNNQPHTILPASKPGRQGAKRKELVLHCLMYGVSMFNEVSELRA